MLSASSEPPNPRLITGIPGKSLARLCHMRMDELPTKTTPPGAGGFEVSSFVRAAISFTHFSGAAMLTLVKAATRKIRRTRMEFIVLEKLTQLGRQFVTP